jgi:hypothetical protein
LIKIIVNLRNNRSAPKIFIRIYITHVYESVTIKNVGATNWKALRILHNMDILKK